MREGGREGGRKPDNLDTTKGYTLFIMVLTHSCCCGEM